MPFFNLPQSGTGIPALSGSGAPSNTLGVDGQLYIDITSSALYGPKKNGEWGSGIAMTGAAWADVTNKPTTFSPSAHQHAIADVTSLQTSLDGKAATSHNHTASQITDFNAAVVAVSSPTTNASLLTSGTLASARLPFATNTIAGAVIVGSGLSVLNGTVSVSTAPSSNLTLSDATPSNLGTASAGSSNLAARADHVHTLPSLSTLGAAAAAHNHPYVTSLNNLTGALTLAAGSNVTLTTNGSTLTIDSKAGLDANAVIDGGDYTGEIVGPVVTITSQPSNTTAYIGYTLANLASGTANLAVGADVVADGSRYLAFGGTTGSSLVASTNKTAWTSLYAMPSEPYARYGECIATAGNTVVISASATDFRTVFLAGGGSQTSPYQRQEIYASTDNASTFAMQFQFGASWTGSGSRRTLAYGGGKFVIVLNEKAGPDSEPYQYFMTSSDGLSWTERRPTLRVVGQNSALLYHSVAYGSGKFVAVARLNTSVNPVGACAVSTDSISWSRTDTTFPFAASAGPAGVVYGNGKFVSLSGANAVASTDGVNWSSFALPSGVMWNGRIVFVDGVFVAYGSGVDAAVSSDGQVWTYVEMPSGVGYGPAASLSDSLLFVSGGTSIATGAVVPSGATSATLAVSAAVTTGVASYQWQVSTDAGTTWANISSATSSTLSLTGLTTADSGKRYRVTVSATGASSVTSQSATLTVTG